MATGTPAGSGLCSAIAVISSVNPETPTPIFTRHMTVPVCGQARLDQGRGPFVGDPPTREISLRPSCELIETLRDVSPRASFRQVWLVVLLSVTIWVPLVRLVLVVAYSFAG